MNLFKLISQLSVFKIVLGLKPLGNNLGHFVLESRAPSIINQDQYYLNHVFLSPDNKIPKVEKY